jgi:sulfopyruvate decarboxylase TPP-binding subunit
VRAGVVSGAAVLASKRGAAIVGRRRILETSRHDPARARRSAARHIGGHRLMGDAHDAPAAWQADIYAALKQGGIRQVPYVPDAGHAHLIRCVHADAAMRGIVLTTEEEGVALAAQPRAAGERAVLLMQSSGVGNCVNMYSLVANGRFPFVTLVTMRGEWAEFNGWQVAMGRATPGVLREMGLAVLRVDRPEAAGDTVRAAIDAAFDGGEAVAVLLSQRLVGRKQWTGAQ